MGLKVLDLNKIKKWVKQDKIVSEGDIDRAIDLTFIKVIEIIKSKCEFYKRYRNNPDLLMQEEFDLFVKNSTNEVKVERKFGCLLLTYPYIRKYNDWLFELTFKEVMPK